MSVYFNPFGVGYELCAVSCAPWQRCGGAFQVAMNNNMLTERAQLGVFSTSS